MPKHVPTTSTPLATSSRVLTIPSPGQLCLPSPVLKTKPMPERHDQHLNACSGWDRPNNEGRPAHIADKHCQHSNAHQHTSTAYYNAVQYYTKKGSTVQHSTTQHHAVQHGTLHCTVLHFRAIHLRKWRSCYSAVRYNTLHYTSGQYTTQQYTTIRYMTLCYLSWTRTYITSIQPSIHRMSIHSRIQACRHAYTIHMHSYIRHACMHIYNRDRNRTICKADRGSVVICRIPQTSEI